MELLKSLPSPLSGILPQILFLLSRNWKKGMRRASKKPKKENRN
jgi:hypothetical protein